MIRSSLPSRLPCAGLALLLLSGTLAGCAPLLVGGAAVGTMLMVSDRRTSGTQIDDEAIELRAGARLREAMGERTHINVTSYNRQVLLTGEAPNADLKQQAEQIVSRIDGVRGIVNEVAVMTTTTLPQRSGDVLITGKVRASFVDASDLQATAFRVVTERGNVYLMGRVTQREADRATQIARQINGVQRVVRIFEVVTPEELRQAGINVPAAPAQPAPPAPAAEQVPQSGGSPAPTGGGAIATPVR